MILMVHCETKCPSFGMWLNFLKPCVSASITQLLLHLPSVLNKDQINSNHVSPLKEFPS